MVFDMERRLVDLNPAARALIGPAADGAIGKMLSEVLPEQKDLILRFRDVEETQAEIVVPLPEGDSRTLELRLSTLRDRRGMATGRLVVLRDITQAKLAERKLAEARDQALEALRMRSRILAVVSHELRTPLGAILGYADMLRAGAQGPITETQMTVVNRMISNAVHLTDLVNDLLDEAQIEQGKITLHIAPIEPSKLMESVETAMGQRAREHGLRLVTVVAPGAPEVIRTDLSRITQIVNNLVGNALKFTRQGDVTVTLLKVDEEHWGISVKDSGPGIAAENQKLIFEPFWQVDHPETREHKGVGLGLSIARQMTQLLGGEITLESEPGKGTTFTVLFPWTTAQEKMISGEKVPGAGR
jgi:PAS domain S-box-containing protein